MWTVMYSYICRPFLYRYSSRLVLADDKTREYGVKRQKPLCTIYGLKNECASRASTNHACDRQCRVLTDYLWIGDYAHSCPVVGSKQ